MRPRAYRMIALGAPFLVSGCGLDQQGLQETASGPEAGADGSTIRDASARDERDLDALVSDGAPLDGAGPDATASGDGGGNEGDGPGDNARDGATDAVGDAGPSGDAEPDGGPCTGGPGACVAVPSGWTLMAFAPVQSSACPTGFTGKTVDLVEGSTVSASACSCGACSVTTLPTCASGPVAVHYDNAGSAAAGTCATLASPGSGPLSNSPPGQCGTDNFHGNYSVFDLRYTPPPPSGGACSVSGIAVDGGVTYASQDRACTPDKAPATPCSGGLCAPNVSGPFKVCIISPGAVACPPGPMTVGHTVATSASVACSDCVGCTVTATCSGTLTLFTDSMCTRGGLDIPADDMCYPVPPQQTNYNAYIYVGGMAQNVGCQASGGFSTPSVALSNQSTICCAP